MSQEKDAMAASPEKSGTLKVLMVVFNPIEYDGRVKRAAETLNKNFQVILFCPVSLNKSKNDLPKEISIRRAWLPWKKWPTSLSLAFFWLQFILWAVAIRPKIIYSHDFYLPFMGIIAAKLVRAKSIYDAHELIIPTSLTKISIRDRIYYWMEKVSIGYYDLVIAANRERAELMKKHYALAILPTPIRNISKPTLGSVEWSILLEQYPDLRRSNDENLIVYMGDVSLERGLGNLIDSLDFLPSEMALIVVGDGPDRIFLQEKYSSESSGKSRVRLLGPVPQSWIQDILNLCDVGVLVYSMEGLNNFYCSPNKIFEYTQAGLPVVTTAQPTLLAMVKQYNIGRVVGTIEQAAQPKHFAEAIHGVFEAYTELKENIPKFLAKHSQVDEQRRLLDITKTLIMSAKAVK